MISVLGIAGWFVVGVIIGSALTLLLVAYWDRKVDLRLMEPLPPVAECMHGKHEPHKVLWNGVYVSDCAGPVANLVSA